ncbi:MAG: DsrE family protein [Ignavibacteriaceae bacterium]|nr:DsrE family protein [Ignavibacteriaceae bacterium]
MAFLTCAQHTESKAVQEQVRDGVFIHISHGTDDPHRMLMGLTMADRMSADKDVILYIDITGIDVVLKDSPDLTLEPFASSKTLIQNLLNKGITIMACPTCLKAAGKTPEDLAEGISVADKEKFFNFTKGRIFTIDY